MRFLLVLLLIAVAGCAVARRNEMGSMSSDQLAAVPDQQLCRVRVNPVVEPSKNVIEEATRRGLGDCSPDHFKCTEMGFKGEDARYPQCRAMVASKSTEEHQKCLSMGFEFASAGYQQCRLDLERNKAMIGAAGAAAPRGNTNCITNRVGYSVITNCN